MNLMADSGNIIDWKVHVYSSLESTQDYVRDLADEDFAEGTAIQSMIQTKGKGRAGREWTSPMGNMYMSVLLRPYCQAMIAAQMSFVVAVAMSEAMDAYVPQTHKKTLKWPNDIFIDGKKCAGILIESILDSKGIAHAMIVGTGVNILSAPEGAVALRDVSNGLQVPIHPFRDYYLSKLSENYLAWKAGGFADIRRKWLAQAHGLGQPITARLPDGPAKGVFRDIDENGALILTLADGSDKVIHTGDVFF